MCVCAGSSKGFYFLRYVGEGSTRRCWLGYWQVGPQWACDLMRARLYSVSHWSHDLLTGQGRVSLTCTADLANHILTTQGIMHCRSNHMLTTHYCLTIIAWPYMVIFLILTFPWKLKIHLWSCWRATYIMLLHNVYTAAIIIMKSVGQWNHSYS